MSLVTEEMKAKAEVYYGDEIGQEKTKELLREVGMPNGLLPLQDIIECGIVRETNFVWLKQKKPKNHKFEKISKVTSYATEVTAVVERHKIMKLTGVKAKEMLVWVTLNEISLDADAGKITFKTPTGLFRTFPASAFEVEEAKKDAAVGKEVKAEGEAVEVKEV